MQIAKLRAKIGSFELDFEGDESFLKTEVSNLVAKIAEAVKSLPAGISQAASGQSNGATGQANGGGKHDHSTNTIASIIDARSGPDLAMAAATHLALVQGRDKFQRKDILDEMQGATTYYNQNYSGNLSKILSSLVRGKRLNLVGTHTFALTKSERDAMEAKLAQSG